LVDLIYVPTTEDHIHHVAQHMRKADVIEVRAAGNRTPLQALQDGYRVSDQTVTVLSPDGVPLVILGIAPWNRLCGVGCPWLLGTDDALKYRRNFLRDPEKVIEAMLDLYPRLENFVHVENRLSVRWLQSIGFIMDEPVIFPNSGELFMKFHRERTH